MTSAKSGRSRFGLYAERVSPSESLFDLPAMRSHPAVHGRFAFTLVGPRYHIVSDVVPSLVLETGAAEDAAFVTDLLNAALQQLQLEDPDEA
jgi:hypothetical protein